MSLFAAPRRLRRADGAIGPRNRRRAGLCRLSVGPDVVYASTMFESTYGEGVSAETWEFRLSQEPARLWSALADTNRLFEALEFPRYALTEDKDPSTGDKRMTARGGQGSRVVEWIEQPFEWATGQWWRMVRRYVKGPMARLEATLYLRRSAGGGSIAQFSLSAEAAGVLGRTLLGSGYLRRLGDLFVRRAEEADDFLAGRAPRVFALKPPILPREVVAAIDARAEEAAARAGGAADPLLGAIAGLLKSAPETDLAEIRPRALAKAFGRAPAAAMEACLAAAEAGLLRRRFTPICPLCRRPTAGADTLAQLDATAHCVADRQDFAIDLAQNVELSFRAAPDLRPLAAGGYCLSGPLTAPHVVLQQELEPGERRALPFHPPAGRYLFRVEATSGETPGGRGPWRQSVDLTEERAPTLLALDEGAAIGGAPPDPALVLENHASQNLRFVLEVRAWRGDATSAATAILTETHRRAFPTDAPSAPLPAGRAYAAAFLANAGLPLREALGPSESARRFAALLRAAADLAGADGGVLLRRGAEAGVGLFASARAAAAFATALREAARSILAGHGTAATRAPGFAETEPPEFDPQPPQRALGLAVGVDEGPIVLIDTGAGLDAAGPGVARAEALASAAGRDGLLVCVEAALAPDAGELWPSGGEEVEVALDEESAPIRAMRHL